jgi:peptide/nickel transport system permease protein
MSLAHAAAALLGLVAARLGGGAADRAIGALLAALYAVPSVLVAWALARAFGPSAALAVPALAVAVSLVASPASQERMAALEALRLDAARAARARGASWPRLLFVHTLRSTALVPATLFGLDLPIALTGACVVERAFGIGGLGEDIVTAIRTHDVSFLMAFGICSAAITAALLVGADAACALLDPRFRELIAKESA